MLSSISCLVYAALLNVFYNPLNQVLGISREYLNLLIVYLLFVPPINMFQSRERYRYQYKVSVFLSLLLSIGTALLSVILVKCMPNRLDGRIYGMVIPSILIGIILYAVIIKKSKEIRPSYWKYALRICLPFVPHLLSMSVLNSVDKIMITNICGAEDNALYSLAYSCGSIISVLIVSMNTAFSPWLGEKLHNKEHSEIRGFAKKYISIFCGVAFLVMLLTPEILLVLGGKSYNEAVFVMPPVMCGCVFQFLYTMYVNVEQFSKKTVGMAFASVSAAGLNFVLNAFFIPRFGYIAAAYTTLVGFLWLLFAHMYLVKRYGLSDVYPNKFVLCTVGTALCASLGVNVLYGYPLVRIAIVILYAFVLGYVVFKKKDMIYKLIKSKSK